MFRFISFLPLSLAIVAGILTGCGTTSSTRLDVVTAKCANFDLRDERPGAQRVSGKTVDVYGIESTTLGDDGIQPQPVELFQTWMNKLPAERLTGKTVVLKEFEIKVYEPDAGKSGTQPGTTVMAGASVGANIVGNLLGRAMVNGFKSARNAKTVYIAINGTVGDQAFNGYAYGDFKGRVTEADINSVVLRALDNLVADVDRVTGPQQPKVEEQATGTEGSGSLTSRD
jgi:hypothetical protein